MSSEGLEALLKEWESHDPNLTRTGVSCKCGSHVSAYFDKGGKEWLIAHVLEHHAPSFDWRGAVVTALAMASTDPKAALEFLGALVDQSTGKPVQADA